MNIEVVRDIWGADWTLSTWNLDGTLECYGCEDTDRRLETGGVKINGSTAIPRGTYKVIISYSPRFKRPLPLLIGVKGFSGIRIHPGNKHADTEGCLLPGATRDEKAGTVGASRTAFDMLFDQINAAINSGEEVTVEVK